MNHATNAETLISNFKKLILNNVDSDDKLLPETIVKLMLDYVNCHNFDIAATIKNEVVLVLHRQELNIKNKKEHLVYQWFDSIITN